MDEKGVTGSSMELFEEQKESFDLIFFKVSCALYAIRLLTESKVYDANWSETRNGMLLGSAHLLGLLAGGVRTGENGISKAKIFHKLEIAQREISELKKLRSEDAKANEKVVSMYATHEQRWFSERKKLRQQIIALMNGLRVLQTKRENSVLKLNEKLQEKEALLMSKEKSIVFEEQKRSDIENKLKIAENSIKNIQESAILETQRHSAEISKHKSAFIELVSNQRQLEAEMGRALRQVESAKEEIESIFEQKEQAVLMTQRLSFELVKVRRDSEQKDQILSAMLRKSKLDTAEKQMLLEEVKLSKAKKKQVEIRTEKFKKDNDSRSEKHSLRSILSKHSNSKRDTNINTARNHHMNYFIEFEQPELLHGQDQYTFNRYQDSTNFKQLDDQGQDEAYGNTIDLRHHLEVDAFTEQLRLKDEKLEAFSWRLLNMELESKKMKAFVVGLDRDLGNLRQENKKLEALLSNRETELQSLKEKLTQKAKKNTLEEAKEITEENQEDKDSNFTHKKDIVLLLQSPERESEEDDEDNTESPDYIKEGFTRSEKAESSSSSVVKHITKTHTSPQKMDIHALGVSYKIQRLKQQLQMLEKLAGKQESPLGSENTDNRKYGMKSFFALLSLLKRQINRYLSLQGKTDDLCQRMHENDIQGKKGNSKAAKSKDETRVLEHYLEETFQLQRYMVASGQKLMELQAKISKGFNEVANELDTPDTFDMKKYSDSIRTHFGEIQQGLEIRISRIIGDIEGTLARDGIIYFKK